MYRTSRSAPESQIGSVLMYVRIAEIAVSDCYGDVARRPECPITVTHMRTADSTFALLPRRAFGRFIGSRRLRRRSHRSGGQSCVVGQ